MEEMLLTREGEGNKRKHSEKGDEACQRDEFG